MAFKFWVWVNSRRNSKSFLLQHAGPLRTLMCCVPCARTLAKGIGGWDTVRIWSKQSVLKKINPEYSSEGLMLKPPILWLPDVKRRLIGKDSDAGKDWSQEEKGSTENEMVVWHHWLSGPGFEQTLRDSEGWESLACPWGCKELDTT